MEIPGYRIMRALGRGGMAHVYLAIQESVQREVALKVMSPTLLGDAEFGERFLREARIAASLQHRHVVQVHDVGRAGDFHYIAMEFLAGGPVLRPGEDRRDIGFCLRVTREIATALDYAHRRGVIHRDIKPDNIMLRADGAAVLSDFGIARASTHSRMTQTGTILGTPHYMSPEQASGAPVDGRADLYSLGIVFHELLVGRVPFEADDWVSVGVMHLSAPVPRLPQAFSAMQTLVDRMLSKDPSARYQTGAELAEALQVIEQGMADRRPPPPPAWPPAADRQTVATPPPQRVNADGDGPVLGAIDQVLSRPSPRARRRTAASAGAAPPSAGGAWRRLLVPLLLLGMLLLAGYAFRDPLRGLLTPTRNEELLLQAETALREGRLSAVEPAGARELFQAVLALDPDNRRARDGLVQVADGLLGEAREALANDRLADARRAIERARGAGAPARDIEAMEADIRSRERRDDELGEVVARAQAALASGRLDQAEDSALALYARALAIDPTSAVAQVGRRDTLTLLLERIARQVAAGELDEAALQIEVVASIDPTHIGLPEAQARLSEARRAKVAGVSSLLAEADGLLRQGRLLLPAGGSARDRYRAVLVREPGNPAAAEGLRQVARALVQQADRAMADFEFERAARLLDDAAASASDAPGLAAARSRLADMRQRRGALAGGSVSPADREAVDRALAAATAARAAGKLMYPPGESAWDLYRRVLAIEPTNAAARAGMTELPDAARQLFEQAMAGNRVSAARGYLEGLETLSPGDAALPGMKRRLAAALLGYAAERLGAGEVARATEALLQASELDPTNPDIASLRARLDQVPR